MRTQRAGWYLYDFAGEVLMTNGGLYFLPWFATDNGFDPAWFNYTLIVTSILLLTTSPLLGRLYDRSFHRQLYLVATTVVVFVATVSLHFIDSINPGTRKALFALIAFGALFYSYQIGLVFYNSLLRNISSERDYVRISGKGAASAWLGAIFGVLLISPFVAGKMTAFHSGGNGAAFLPAALLYALIITFSLFFLKKLKGTAAAAVVTVAQPPVHLLSRARNAFQQNRNACLFLAAMFFFSDAILTIQDNASFYLQQVMSFTEVETAGLIILLLLAAAIGSLAARVVTSAFGAHRTLIGILAGWAIAIIVVSQVTDRIVFAILFAVIGLLHGSLWTIARAYFLTLAPPAHSAQYFGFYSSIQRFSTIVGPFLWVTVARASEAHSSTPYRFSMLGMAILLCCSYPFLRAIRPTRNTIPAT